MMQLCILSCDGHSFLAGIRRSHMMSTATLVGLAAAGGKRVLGSSSSYYCNTDLGDKLLFHGGTGSVVPAAMRRSSSSCSSSCPTSSLRIPNLPSSSGGFSQSPPPPVKAFSKERSVAAAAETATFHHHSVDIHGDLEDENSSELEFEYSLDALLLLQKSMLESQWHLSVGEGHPVLTKSNNSTKEEEMTVTCSGTSARRRRISSRRRKVLLGKKPPPLSAAESIPTKQPRSSAVSPELMRNHRMKGYLKGFVSNDLLAHREVVHLSRKIKAGLTLDEHKSRLKKKLGCEPSDEQLATSLNITRTELRSKLMECSLAREKLTMSNVRLVMSIAQRYDKMGAEMSDLVQGGLIGLLRGIEKFDSSKGFKISTYVYWWIRQGVSRALIENSRTLRLPAYLHGRLGLIRSAKSKLQEKGITPSVDRIAECLNMSEKKVRNATEAIGEVFSLDRDAFPSLNGLPGESHHSYIADNRVENNPWHGVDEWALKNEVNSLIHVALGEREREIIRLYYGLDNECLTWEDISKRIGLSRERVRQVGLVAMEKLKHVARKRKMDAMLVKH